MGPHLEKEIAEVQHEKDDRNTVTHRQKICAFLLTGQGQPVAGSGSGDGEVEC